jgi:RNA polymerase sigma-70 factor (ECF subfamily)
MSSQPVRAGLATSPNDIELVRRILSGDTRAPETLMRRHNLALYRTARAILRDEAEAEDAVQDAYLRAFTSLEGFRGESSLATWLIRIAANEALMRLRKQRRLAEVIPIDPDNGEALMGEIPDTREAGPERSALNSQVRRLIERGIDALPDMYRTVFVLRAVHEMSVAETSEALGLPEPTVRTRFFRARALLRSSLEADMDEAMASIFGFDGERCDRIVAGVLARLAALRPA